MLLKIANENYSNTQFRTFGDVANNQHVFEWNAEIGAYCYEPKSQQESDEIISSNWISLNNPWRIAPVWNGQPGTKASVPTTNTSAIATFKIPPYVRPEIYAEYPVRDLLDLCADAGFIPEGDQNGADNLRRQLHRYYEGRAWAVEDMKRLRERIAELEKKVSLPASAPLAAKPVEAPKAHVKRGRPPKVRELQTA